MQLCDNNKGVHFFGVFLYWDTLFYFREILRMDMYQKMYYHLFNAVTDSLEENDVDIIKSLLIKAQQETEEIYISWNEKN